jgi:ankyrin repeat protein
MNQYPDAPSSDPLIVAAKNGDVKTTEALLQNGGYIFEADDNNETPLIHAARGRHKAVVQLLLDHGADINEQGMFVASNALCAAAGNDDIDLVLFLLDKGANCPDVALLTATENGCTEIAELLLDRGADIHAKDELCSLSPLMWAAEGGHIKTARMLLERGADINQKDNDNWTALMMASRAGQSEMGRLLLDAGADTDTVSGAGYTALALAEHNNHPEIVKILRDESLRRLNAAAEKEENLRNDIARKQRHLKQLMRQHRPKISGL